MPFNGAGVFAVYTPGTPYVTGTTISSTVANNVNGDFATGLSNCVTRDGQSSWTANLPAGGFKITGLGAGTASGNSIRYEQVNGVVTTAGDTLYATGAGVLARLAIGTANQKLFTNAGATAPEWAKGLKTGSFTRDMTAASGSAAITGVGFKPSAVVFFATSSVTKEQSWGSSDGTSNGATVQDGNGNATVAGSSAIYIDQAAGNVQSASVASFDADGFTLTWTKSGSPTGTGTIKYTAFR